MRIEALEWHASDGEYPELVDSKSEPDTDKDTHVVLEQHIEELPADPDIVKILAKMEEDFNNTNNAIDNDDGLQTIDVCDL